MSNTVLNGLYEQFVMMHSADNVLKAGPKAEVKSMLPGNNTMWLTEEERRFHDNLAKLCHPDTSRVTVETVVPTPKVTVKAELPAPKGNEIVLSVNGDIYSDADKMAFYKKVAFDNDMFGAILSLATYKTRNPDEPPYPWPSVQKFKASVVDLIDANIKRKLGIVGTRQVPDLSKVRPMLNQDQADIAASMTRQSTYRFITERLVRILNKRYAHITTQSDQQKYLPFLAKKIIHDFVNGEFSRIAKAVLFTYHINPDYPEYKNNEVVINSPITQDDYEYSRAVGNYSKKNAGKVAYDIVSLKRIISCLGRPQVLVPEYYETYSQLLMTDGSMQLNPKLPPVLYYNAIDRHFASVSSAIGIIAEDIVDIMKPGPFFSECRTEDNKERKADMLKTAIRERISMLLCTLDTGNGIEEVEKCAREFSIREGARKKGIYPLPPMPNYPYVYAYLYRLGRMAAYNSVRFLKVNGSGKEDE